MVILRYLRKNQEIVFYSALLLMVISLPLSRFGLSVAQFSILGIWLLGNDLPGRVLRFFKNRAAIILVSFYLLHVIGLIYTSDYSYALKDLRIKLPLLLLPVVFSTFPLPDKKKTDNILLIYIAAVLVASFISLGILLFTHYDDFRDLSPFISHIRLSLNVCLAIFFAMYYVLFSDGKSSLIRWFLGIFAIWLVFFLIIIESVTGIIILFIAILIFLFYNALKVKRLRLKIAMFSLLIILPLSFIIYLRSTIESYLTPQNQSISHLESRTALGNLYVHDTINQPVENGSYIGVYVCESEMRDSWNKLSTYDYDGFDERDQEIKYTLMRYLNSKHLRKDAAGVHQLNSWDIQNIESGIANVYYAKKFCINARIYRLLWEYQVTQFNGNPGGHSLIQRFEYWKTSIEIISHNLFIGVGSGDIDQAFKQAYETMNSPLDHQWRNRSHNQFLATFVSFGIIGLFWFLFSLFYPAILLRKFSSFRYIAFFITLFISMLVEDTLETQMGVTLFAFFNSFLLFGVKEE